MKTKTVLIVAAVAAALQFGSISYAQAPEDGSSRRHNRHAAMLANLTPEERAKLRSAHQKVKADPALQAAKERRRQAAREYRDLRRQKMLEADPTLQPILDKIQTSRRNNI